MNINVGIANLFNILCMAGVIWFLGTPEKEKLCRCQANTEKKRLIWNGWLQSSQTLHYCRFQQLEQQQKAAAGHPAILVPPEFKQSFLCISSLPCWEDGYPALRHESMDSSYVGRMLVRFWPRELKDSSKGKSGHEQGLERKEVL